MIYGQHDFPLTTNHYCPGGVPEYKSSWVNSVTAIRLSLCGHLGSHVHGGDNERSAACGEGGHHRSGSSQRDLVTSLYAKGKCDD